ncbi:hypothetical protein [Aurantiacibacter gilvus]|uniref:Uncharacterized protein n=1 Tax=Aurantiacibacter gilvus TaxID=3139141 RepID=A0ABU9IEH7_9SPHN
MLEPMRTPERQFFAAASRDHIPDAAPRGTQTGRMKTSGISFVLCLAIVTAPLFLQHLCEDVWLQAASVVLL